ncbi:MAG: hypothetical protein ACE5FT_03025 [Candidatus Nanoarchaeia archaeon]
MTYEREEPKAWEQYRAVYPKDTTNRKTDLSNLTSLLEGDKPVALVSVDRNGTTTLLNQLGGTEIMGIEFITKQRDEGELDSTDLGILAESMTRTIETISSYKNKEGPVNTPVVVDEIGDVLYFDDAKNPDERLKGLAEAAKNYDNKMVLRFHPSEDEQTIEDAGFEVYHCGKLSFDEFKGMIVEPIEGTEYSIQEDALREIHDYGPNAMGNNHLTYHAFEHAASEGRTEVTLEDVNKAKPKIINAERQVVNQYMISEDWDELKDPTPGVYERLEKLGLADKTEDGYKLAGYITDKLSAIEEQKRSFEAQNAILK